MSRKTLVAVVLVGGALAAFACDRSPVAPADRARGLPPLVIMERQQRQLLDELTRAVAMSLARPAVRQAVYDALHASPYREHKLHLPVYLRNSGRPLLAAMAALRGAGATESAVLKTADSAIDLEFYMPVKSHFASWTGDDNLIVATALRDHEIPVAYDLRGERVVLTSADVPPATPTLAIVPVETDFRRVPQPGANVSNICYTDRADAAPSSSANIIEDCGGGGGGSPPPPPPPPPSGVYMTFSYVPGDYEGFLMGDPEFEVHALARRSATDTGFVDLQCSGEHAADGDGVQSGIRSSAYVYDQNGSSWSGQVLLFSKAQIDSAQGRDTAVVYWMWEDDNTACKIVKNQIDVSEFIKRVAQVVDSGWSGIKAIFDGKFAVGFKKLASAMNIFSSLQNDDIVGLIVAKEAVKQEWTDATHAIVTYNSDNTPNIQGRVKLVVY